MSWFKEMKFRVSDAADSEAIQRVLFALGYRWWIDDIDRPHWIHEPCLHTSMDGYISFSDLHYFKNSPYVSEYTFDKLVGEVVREDIDRFLGWMKK